MSTSHFDENSMDQEQLWLDLARQGDKAAFGQLIEAYQRPVFNLAYRLLDNAAEAEEASQEAFIRAYTRLETYNPAHRFSTWLLSIANNYCIDLLRKRRALILSIEEPMPPHPALMTEKREGPEAQTMMAEQQAMVQSLLQVLPEDHRQVIALRYWEGLPNEEIGVIIGMSTSAVKSRLFRARRRLAAVAEARGLVPEAEVPAAPADDAPPARTLPRPPAVGREQRAPAPAVVEESCLAPAAG